MITALCHSKLSRELEGMEDLLTSAVFGRLKYMSPRDGLIPFLSHARYANGDHALSGGDLTQVQYHFWPWWQFNDCHGAEPDLVIEYLAADGVRHKVLIEAKFRSGKSSEADIDAVVPADQLAREWDNLVHSCQADGAIPVLIYLTADFAIPVDDLVDSEAEYRLKRSKSEFPFRCAWLSWRHLGPALANHESAIAQDIIALVQRLDLSFFAGIRAHAARQIEWRYRQLVTPFSLEIPKMENWTWAFRK